MQPNTKYISNNQGAHRFTMWLFIITTTMIFAGFTSAFLVRKGAGGAWTSFAIPAVFQTSTLLIVLSSVFLQVAHMANKRQHKLLTSAGLFLTMVLGVLFCYFQFQGWKQLTDAGLYLSFNPNPATPFFYVITFIHALHVAFAILFIFVAWVRSVWLMRKSSPDVVMKQLELQEKGILTIRTDLLTMFWHFMGILWVYLFLFLTINLK